MGYIILLLVLVSLLYLITEGSGVPPKNRKRTFLFLSGVVVMMFYLFKDNSSLPDIDDYIYRYNQVQKVSFGFLLNEGAPEANLGTDIGFLLYNKVLSLVSPDYYLLIFITALIVILGYFSFVGKYSDNVLMSVFLFILGPFYHSLFILRQFVAIAICLTSIPFIIRKKALLFILLIGLAFTFHKSAVVFLVLYPLYNMRIGKGYVVLMGGIAFILVSLKFFFIENAILLLKVPEVYMEANDANGGETTYTFFIINMVIMTFVLFFGRVRTLEGVEKLMLDALTIVLIIDLVGVGMDGTIAGRLATFFTSSYIILLPNICKRIKSVSLRFFVEMGILCCFFLTFRGGFSFGFSF